MAKHENNDLPHIYVRIDGDKDVNAICYMLRGLFKAVGNSDGHQKKNQQFQRGVIVSFGSGPIAGLFLDAFERLFRKRVRDRIEMRRH